MPSDMSPPTSPPEEVLESFGAHDPVVRLAGGLGTSFRAGHLVLKPAENPAEATWTSFVMDTIPERGFRVARPIRGATGEWVVNGWTATRFLPGRTGSAGQWATVLSVARDLHQQLKAYDRPDFLTAADHPHARANRYVWQEEPLVLRSPFHTWTTELRACMRPVLEPSQIIHGDMSENLLFDDRLPPAVIDFSPYWRPAAFAEAIIVADAMLWSDGTIDLIDFQDDPYLFGQFLLRALIFRLVAQHERDAHVSSAERDRHASCFQPVANEVINRSRQVQTTAREHT